MKLTFSSTQDQVPKTLVSLLAPIQQSDNSHRFTSPLDPGVSRVCRSFDAMIGLHRFFESVPDYPDACQMESFIGF
uniref:Uncharacterized protein n=1 Tax=Noccaea caerulescens TaxID=107243 RepID=A0A1J3D7U0_NOCCA